MTTNVVLSKSINNVTYQVIIFTTRVEENLTKGLTIITPSKPTKGQTGSNPGDADFGPEDTLLIDLLRKFEHRITVDGYIADEFGTATAGGNSTLTDSSKSWVTDEFNSLTIKITNGTGVGQSKTITGTATNVITISGTWTTNPDTTSDYEIVGSAPTLRSYLKYIFEAGGTFTLAYDGTNYTVDMDKISIIDAPEDESTSTKYNVKFTAVKGIDMPARS